MITETEIIEIIQEALYNTAIETEIGEIILEALYNVAIENGDDIDISTFNDVDILINNEGLIIQLFDGSEFQVTIVKSN